MYIENNTIKGMTFGEALEKIKAGQLVTRTGWNGRNMFIFARPYCQIPITTVIDDIESIPIAVKQYYEYVISNADGTRIAEINDSDIVEFSSYISMKDSKNNIVNGWLASQTDMLTEDWEVFEY